jgi:AraC-like DNA-binding protein
MGPIGAMFSTAHDLAGGLRVLGRALPILLQHDDVRVEISKRGGEVWYRSPNASPRHGIDSMFAAILTLSRQCCDHHVVPLAVQLQFAAPGAAAAYARFYGVPPAFDQEACVLRFAVRDLARRFRGSHARTHELLLSHTDELVGPGSELPLAKIEHAIERAIARGDGSLPSVAELLGVSARTLQRRLAGEGATFDALRSRVRYESALAQLGRGVPVSKVATALGYGSRTAFSRAFHRWTGTSPMAYAAGFAHERRRGSP